MRAKKTAGADIRLGVSVDQLAAASLGHNKKLPSLELSCDAAEKVVDGIQVIAVPINSTFPGEMKLPSARGESSNCFERLFGSNDSGSKEERTEELGNKKSRLRS